MNSVGQVTCSARSRSIISAKMLDILVCFNLTASVQKKAWSQSLCWSPVKPANVSSDGASEEFHEFHKEFKFKNYKPHLVLGGHAMVKWSKECDGLYLSAVVLDAWNAASGCCSANSISVFHQAAHSYHPPSPRVATLSGWKVSWHPYRYTGVPSLAPKNTRRSRALLHALQEFTVQVASVYLLYDTRSHSGFFPDRTR